MITEIPEHHDSTPPLGRGCESYALDWVRRDAAAAPNANAQA